MQFQYRYRDERGGFTKTGSPPQYDDGPGQLASVITVPRGFKLLNEDGSQQTEVLI